MTTNTNPWNLTKGQVAVMDAICEHGCQKLAARALGVASKTIETQAYLAGVRMKKRSYLEKYLAWDRWRRSQPKAEANVG